LMIEIFSAVVNFLLFAMFKFTVFKL